MPGHIGQVQVHQHQIVVIETKEVERVAPRLGMLAADPLLTQLDKAIASAAARYFANSQGKHVSLLSANPKYA
jgi:hypothetical protein